MLDAGLLLGLSLVASGPVMSRPDRPAPCVGSAWYHVAPSLEKTSLPPGVELIRQNKLGPSDGLPYDYSLALWNRGDVPLVLFSDYQLIPLLLMEQGLTLDPKGTVGRHLMKLQANKAYRYFESGLPYAGKEHLKGWQCLADVWGDPPPKPGIKPGGEQIIPSQIHELHPKRLRSGAGRPAGAQAPAPEPFALKVLYGDKIVELKGKYRYSLNPDYDPRKTCD